MAENRSPGGSKPLPAEPPATLPEAPEAAEETPELDESPGEEYPAPMFHRPTSGVGGSLLPGVRGCPYGLTGMCVFCPEFPCNALVQAVLQRLMKEHLEK